MIQLLVRRDMSHPEFWLGAEVSSPVVRRVKTCPVYSVVETSSGASG